MRRLDTPTAASLTRLVETFEDLQMVLRCCERLMTELTPQADHEPDEVVVEAVWTMALLSYTRCFTAGETEAVLGEADLQKAQPSGEVLEWHEVLLRLREHYTDPVANPRERASVGVAQDADGAATGLAVTSARQPLVDDVTVRQTGAVAYALSALVNERVEALQGRVFEELKGLSESDLNDLATLEVAPADGE